MDLAEKVHARTMSERGYGFTVKATLAHGRLRFGRLVNGYSLAGSVLIETVRVLSHIVEKDGNVLVFDQRMVEALGAEASCADYAEVQLKGFSGTRRLVRFLAVPAVSTLWERKDWKGLAMRRSDQEIQQALDWLVDSMRNQEHEHGLRLIGVLRQTSISDASPERTERFCQAIESILHETEVATGSREPQLKVLSGAIKLFESLVPVSDWSGRIEQLIQRAMTTRERRVIANALDVLTTFKTESDPEFGLRLIRHADNRIAANALLKEGIRELSPKVVRELRRMIKQNKEPGRQASAIYALGELTKFYQETDPVYLKVQVDFLTLLDRIEPLLRCDNEMVRRQTRLALKKAGRLQEDDSGSAAAAA
jgi:hypothetical protein